MPHGTPLFASSAVYLGDTLFCSEIRDGVFAGKFKSNDTNLQSTLKSLTKIAERTINKYVSAFDALEEQP